MPQPTVAYFESRARQLVSELRRATGAPQEELIRQLGAALACRGVLKDPRTTRRSVAAFAREHLGSSPLAAAVREAAVREEVRARELLAPRGPAPLGMVTMTDVAAHYGVPHENIQALLPTPAGRRRLGWAVHVGGGEFRFNAALLSVDRAAFLQALPRDEPDHHLAPLPNDYEA